MNARKLSIVLLLLLVPIIPVWTQTTFIFRDGLAISNCHQCGRQAMFTDQLALRMFSPAYQSPKTGIL